MAIPAPVVAHTESTSSQQCVNDELEQLLLQLLLAFTAYNSDDQ